MKKHSDQVTASDDHNAAMNLADEATRAARRGDLVKHRDLLSQALTLETAAADKYSALDADEPTRSILHRSAASLALALGEWRSAERLCARGLSADPPEPLAEEMREVLSWAASSARRQK